MIENAQELLKKGEIFDDLQLNDIYIIQNRSKYCFSVDSVLLANFAKIGHKDYVVELCSGSGVVSILCHEKYHPKRIVGVEIDKELWDMSTRTLRANNINDVEFLNIDLKNSTDKLGCGKVDKIVCNPPYYPLPNNVENINKKYLSTKYEQKTNIDEVMTVCAKLLKNSGKLFISFPAERLQILLSCAKDNNLACKTIKFVCAGDKDCHLILAEFFKCGGEGVKISFETI